MTILMDVRWYLIVVLICISLILVKLTHWKRLWCWEGLGAGGEGDNRGWDGWMASLSRWTWVWVNSEVGDGQGGLACCNSWGSKESDTTEQLSLWAELNWIIVIMNIFSCACWWSVYFLWRNVYLDLRPIFQLGFFCCCWVTWVACIFWKLSPC